MSGQPYSEAALARAMKATAYGSMMISLKPLGEEMLAGIRHEASSVLDAAHDREKLGLDASVCARTHLLEVVAALRQSLLLNALHDDTGDPHDEGYSEAQAEVRSWLDVLEREAKS